MIENRTVLGLITARGGSKGLRRKNLFPLAGKTLLQRTIDCGTASRLIDRLVISSDDEEILQAARDAGCEVPFVRPDELARDDTPHSSVISHALQNIGDAYDYFVLLQPTSPLRTAEDVDGCIELCHAASAPVAISVTAFDKNPGTVVAVNENYRMQSLLRSPRAEGPRQGEQTYILNGAVYVCRSDWWFEHERFVSDDAVAYIMPRERSVDIDEERDIVIAEALMKLEHK